MRYVSNKGDVLFDGAPECLPMLARLENEVFVKPTFMEPTETSWSAEEGVPPPQPPKTILVPFDGDVPLPVETELAVWIQVGHDALGGTPHTITNEPLSAYLQNLMNQRPIKDLGVLLDRLDFLGRPLVFDVVVHAALNALTYDDVVVG